MVGLVVFSLLLSFLVCAEVVLDWRLGLVPAVCVAHLLQVGLLLSQVALVYVGETYVLM